MVSRCESYGCSSDENDNASLEQGKCGYYCDFLFSISFDLNLDSSLMTWNKTDRWFNVQKTNDESKRQNLFRSVSWLEKFSNILDWVDDNARIFFQIFIIQWKKSFYRILNFFYKFNISLILMWKRQKKSMTLDDFPWYGRQIGPTFQSAVIPTLMFLYGFTLLSIFCFL